MKEFLKVFELKCLIKKGENEFYMWKNILTYKKVSLYFKLNQKKSETDSKKYKNMIE